MTTTMLPPTPRDFDIHRASCVHNHSTRQIAEKHVLSQTRVRQIIDRVNTWLALALPATTELEGEQQARLARHLAADQLAAQCAELQTYWSQTGDPKYQRQKTRVILAMARLGVPPGKIEAVAADAIEGPYDPAEPQPAWSEDDPWATFHQAKEQSRRADAPQMSGVECSSHSPLKKGTGSEPIPQIVANNDRCEVPVPLFQQPANTAEPSASSPPNPLPEDCSPVEAGDPNATFRYIDPDGITTYYNTLLEAEQARNQRRLEGVKRIEARLLSQIADAEATPGDEERCAGLQQLLGAIRKEKSVVEIELSRHQPGATLKSEPPAAIPPVPHSEPAAPQPSAVPRSLAVFSPHN